MEFKSERRGRGREQRRERKRGRVAKRVGVWWKEGRKALTGRV